MQSANEFNPFQNNYSINCGGLLTDFSTPKIMGIVNLTPDSFFEGSRKKSEKETLELVEKHLSEGADFIDLGAFSSGPNSCLITQEEEQKRLIVPLQLIVKEFPKAVISVDTYRSEIAKQVINEGAHLINDISGGNFDEQMFATIANLRVPYILMHMQGEPKTMQHNPNYKDVFKEIYSEFFKKLTKLKSLGAADVILDVGFGFGKTNEHNYTLLKNLLYFHSLDCPVLVGISRKKMIQNIIGENANNSLNGTTAVNAVALLNGANILRVHDVKAAKETIQIVDFYQKQ